MTPQEKFQTLTKIIQTKIPNFQNKTKDQSFLLSKVLGPVISIFNKNYFTDFVTTIGNTVYWPSQESMNTDWAYKTLAHEFVHLVDNKRNPILFPIKYLFPQILSVFALGALGAFWSPWCLLFLTFLLALLPWPSRGRTQAEMRGYTMTLAITEVWYWGDASSELINRIVPYFTSMAYCRMCPNETEVRNQLNNNIIKLVDKSIFEEKNGEPFKVVHKMLVDIGDFNN